MEGLGHIVLRVQDLKKSIPFYQNILGLKLSPIRRPRMAFFFFDNSIQSLSLVETPSEGGPDFERPGLDHIALKIGETGGELEAFRSHLQKNRIPVIGGSHHKGTSSIYLLDPDGIEIEVYVDSEEDARAEAPSPTLAFSGPEIF